MCVFNDRRLSIFTYVVYISLCSGTRALLQLRHPAKASRVRPRSIYLFGTQCERLRRPCFAPLFTPPSFSWSIMTVPFAAQGPAEITGMRFPVRDGRTIASGGARLLKRSSCVAVFGNFVPAVGGPSTAIPLITNTETNSSIQATLESVDAEQCRISGLKDWLHEMHARDGDLVDIQRGREVTRFFIKLTRGSAGTGDNEPTGGRVRAGEPASGRSTGHGAARAAGDAGTLPQRAPNQAAAANHPTPEDAAPARMSGVTSSSGAISGAAQGRGAPLAHGLHERSDDTPSGVGNNAKPLQPFAAPLHQADVQGRQEVRGERLGVVVEPGAENAMWSEQLQEQGAREQDGDGQQGQGQGQVSLGRGNGQQQRRWRQTSVDHARAGKSTTGVLDGGMAAGAALQGAAIAPDAIRGSPLDAMARGEQGAMPMAPRYQVRGGV